VNFLAPVVNGGSVRPTGLGEAIQPEILLIFSRNFYHVFLQLQLYQNLLNFISISKIYMGHSVNLYFIPEKLTIKA
jgi:hypothetical protein